ncbi:MAG: ATP-grasp domain-containing protein [Actinomycetota bacterium]|nr:ATP-grasp domain-containing protein [Actinomycetota bacterium]
MQQFVARLADTARHIGLRVIALPYEFGEVSIEDALDRVGRFEQAVGFLSRFISTPEYYEQLYQGAIAHGIAMINTVGGSRTLMEFDRFYPLISDLTAPSVIIRTSADCESALATLGSPAFVKGLVKSRKENGWEACLAHDTSELEAMLARAERFEISERGAVIARTILPLRQNGVQVAGFPVSREYRVYVLDGAVIGSGFYGKGYDTFGPLTDAETDELLKLAASVAGRIDVRLAAVDVAQLTDGSWTVIELGDPQYSGIAHMPHHLLCTPSLTRATDTAESDSHDEPPATTPAWRAEGRDATPRASMTLNCGSGGL